MSVELEEFIVHHLLEVPCANAKRLRWSFRKVFLRLAHLEQEPQKVLTR